MPEVSCYGVEQLDVEDVVSWVGMEKAAAPLAHYLLKKVASDHTHPMKLCSQYCSANLRRLVTAG